MRRVRARQRVARLARRGGLCAGEEEGARMAAVTSRRARSGPASVIPGADQVSWYFLRVSGVLLIVFALGHILFTHYLHVPSATTFNFVAGRWANPLWRTFDWILLLLALWHGLIGLRISVTDFIRSEGWQVV